MFQISEEKNWLYSFIPQAISMLIHLAYKGTDYDYEAILDKNNLL